MCVGASLPEKPEQASHCGDPKVGNVHLTGQVKQNMTIGAGGHGEHRVHSAGT